jgi:type IV secretory pathway ATPase VirB11/archaellum biosynthesis ATPase
MKVTNFNYVMYLRIDHIIVGEMLNALVILFLSINIGSLTAMTMVVITSP